ncbi:hypothetical protein LAZ67_12003281 [Cordylochernes scorpioides]|uniref:Transposase n=1 Tax=Cordylochernes scorpioides TaxID=51811 RepID=A0ABY6L2B8_9ARAC|nr:hypothetical protein LAZ67_12003281 [Cordylochernes scorpioides]
MFSEGREDVNDEERAGRPSTSTTDEKINEVEKMILANLPFDFINDLGMRRVAAKFVPKLLICDQKQHRMNIANEMLDSVRDDPNLLQRIITGDEAWVYGYDVENKAQSSQWKLPHEPRPKKARQVRSNGKVLLTVFFDCRGVVHHEFLPQGRTVNKEYYLQVMRNLREAIRQKRPDLWKNKNWLLHHDNAPSHTSLLVRDFLAKNNTLMMPQPPYSPDLAPCDFFLFPKLKRPMKGRRYTTLDEIKTASKEELIKILKNDFLKFFEDWKNRWHKIFDSQWASGQWLANQQFEAGRFTRVTSTAPIYNCNRMKYDRMNCEWHLPAYPNHHWYKPFKQLEELQQLNRNQQTVLARLRPYKTLKFQNRNETFNNCLKCNSAEASPEHIMLRTENRGPIFQAYNYHRKIGEDVVMKSNREFENRAAIIVALRAGRSPKEIVDFLKLPKTTIYRVKKQFDEADSNKEGIATRKKHSRRSDRVRGEEFVKNVKEKIDGNPGKSMRAIAKEMDVGSMTIVRTIHEDLGLKSYALRKGQLLTENMKNNRKGKAAALLNNLKHDSFGMLRFFSDEKNFDVDQKVNPRNDRWICKDPSEIPVVMHTKFPASVMVLGVISSEGDVMPPHFFEKGLRMNADTYINVLETVVKPWMDMVAAGRKYVFQQDSAPAHKAKKTQSWLTLNVPSHWGPDIWPPNSPDCNPLDYYVWGVVERDVNKAPHTTIQSVKKAVHTVMTQMDKVIVAKACASFRTRLETVVANNGNYIE